jgi:ABC-2 type transport system ATP-binding protein
VEQLCSRIAILRDGNVVAEGPTAELLAAGEGLLVAFDTAADAAAAIEALREGSSWAASPAGDTAIVVEAPATEASAVNRLLVGDGLFAAELRVRRQSLEAVFRELTVDRDEPVADG